MPVSIRFHVSNYRLYRHFRGFSKVFCSPNMVFLGVNADDTDKNAKVMDVLMKNACLGTSYG